MTALSLQAREDFKIHIDLDKENRTIKISDNGIGMTAEELENNLGTIAKSGSFNFKKENADNEKTDDISVIGQFGVGFYSSFMVADKVEVISKAFGENVAHKWVSTGADGYTIEECEKENAGSEITLYVKADTENEDYSKYLEQYTIDELVKKYSDYIRYPIVMEMSHQVPDPDKEGEYITEVSEETLNSMVPLWRKNKSEIKPEEYNEFYKQKFMDYNNPLHVIHTKTEVRLHLTHFFTFRKIRLTISIQKNMKKAYSFIQTVFLLWTSVPTFCPIILAL